MLALSVRVGALLGLIGWLWVASVMLNGGGGGLVKKIGRCRKNGSWPKPKLASFDYAMIYG